jgi:hemerythrin
MQQFQTGETGAIQNLMNFLADWLRHHIKGEDQKMIQFMQQKHHQLATV